MKVIFHEDFYQVYTFDPAAGAGRMEAIVAEIASAAEYISAEPATEEQVAELGVLEAVNLQVDTFATEGEPTIALAQRGAEAARTNNADVVIGFGGGSALDAAKALAARIAANGPLAVKAVVRSLREQQECMAEEDAMIASDELAGPVFASADAKEGMRAFKEKRPAQFTGK